MCTEPEAGVVGAGPEGAGPQRTSVTLHLSSAAPGPAQRLRHTPQNLQAPQEVRAELREERSCWISCSYQLFPVVTLSTAVILEP